MSERLRSVVEQRNIRPGDRVLEIGCGHGVAATLVCQRLEEGHLSAINHSAKMIQAATRRNGAYLQAGRAEFLVATLEDLDLGDRRFDKIFAVRVGSFTMSPSVHVASSRDGSRPATRSSSSSTRRWSRARRRSPDRVLAAGLD